MRIFLLSILLFTPLFSSAQLAKNVRLLCNWRDTTNAPVNGSGQHFNDLWGFTMNGREYGVIGGTNGLHIIDVNTCQEKAFAPGRTSNVVHRDYKTYKNYLYAVCDEGYASLQIYDLKYLPDSIHKVYDDHTYITRAHTIFIDTATARMYAAGATDIYGMQSNIQIHSLQNPEKPDYLGGTKDVVYTHAVYARNDTIWCSNAYEGFHIITARFPPVTNLFGGLINYPEKGYNHSSWMGYDGIGLMADETFGKRVKVIDASDPENVQVLSMFAPRGNDTLSIAHNPYLLDRTAIVSWYMDGLQFYDLSDPRNPVQTGYFNPYTGAAIQTFAGIWGAYPYLPSRKILASDMQNGLYVLDASEALSVSKTKATSTLTIYPNPVRDGQTLRIALPAGWSGETQLQIRDVTGRRLMNRTLQNSGNAAPEVSLPRDWPEGIYLLQVSGPAGLLGSRVIKR